ncbi:hypothetical protein KC19_3G000100 [Ceratodon purpureus]|uniref:Uncharacterized protein n=1 Tax=Ceratodon purpureus TaxID=3225 RepID=A0A8T0IFM5_CERPU|nr:hypothetical protein KC19_3G000100 [Ceratodon purpureus]
MYSAATAQSTMDFSTKAIDDDVVDSPPFGGKRPHSVSSPSPLKSRTPITSPKSSTRNVGAPQRKLYDDSEMVDLPVPKEATLVAATPSPNISESPAAKYSPRTTSTLLNPSAIPSPRKNSEAICSSGDLQRKSPPPPIRTVAPADIPRPLHFRTGRPPLSDVLRQTQSHDGFLARRVCPPVRDAWEQRVLKLQRRENSRYRSSSYTGYSRGPEILKAMAELKSRSHS